MNVVYLLLGGNMDDRASLLRQARELINKQIGKITHESSIYESEPWGFQSDQVFLNQAIRLETYLSASVILHRILKIENKLGRKRINGDVYSSRPIDIDILFYNEEIIFAPGLVIPHPRISERRFTLVPLLELNQKLIHPSFQKTIGELMLECPDSLQVKLYSPLEVLK